MYKSRHVCVYVYLKKKIYYNELLSTFRKADKSQDMQSASWKLWRAHGIRFQLKAPGWRPKSWCFSLSLRAGKRSKALRGKIISYSAFLFSQVFNWFHEAHTHIGKGHVPCSIDQFQCQSQPKTPSPSRIKLDQLSQHRHDMAWHTWHTELTVTVPVFKTISQSLKKWHFSDFLLGQGS